jgi:hypothetical protein
MKGPAIVIAWVDLVLCMALIASGIRFHDWRPIVGGVVAGLLIVWILRRLTRAAHE